MPYIKHRMQQRKLWDLRFRAAEHRLRCYDFGHEVIDFGDWSEHGRDGGHWRRSVRLRSGQVEVDVLFAITFAVNTNHMIEAYAVVPGDTPLLIGQWSDDVLR